jgi:hypothetical protein
MENSVREWLVWVGIGFLLGDASIRVLCASLAHVPRFYRAAMFPSQRPQDGAPAAAYERDAASLPLLGDNTAQGGEMEDINRHTINTKVGLAIKPVAGLPDTTHRRVGLVKTVFGERGGAQFFAIVKVWRSFKPLNLLAFSSLRGCSTISNDPWPGDVNKKRDISSARAEKGYRLGRDTTGQARASLLTAIVG